MPSKRLIIVVDGAAELNSHWQTTLRDLIADIVSWGVPNPQLAKYLHQDGSTSQDPEARKPQLSLIVYGSEGPCTETQALPWGWTNDVNTFLTWLSAVRFYGGEFTEAALTKGLQTALKTIAAARDSNEVNILGDTHCILVTSYKSLPSLKDMNEDQTLYNERLLQKLDRFLSDSTSVARNFAQSSVTLSIISPDKSPRLEKLFAAGGNFNCLGQLYNLKAQYCGDERGNINYLLLLSHNFMEAYTVFINRDLKIKPANDNYRGKSVDLGKHPILSKEMCLDGDVETTGNNFSQVMPLNPYQTRLREIEVFMLESGFDNDVIWQQQNVLEWISGQHDTLTNKITEVDAMMRSLEDYMYQPLASPIQYHGWTAPSKSHLGIGTSKAVNVRHLPLEYMAQDEHRVKRKFADAVGQSSKADPEGSTPSPYSYTLLGMLPFGYDKAWEGDIMTVEEGESLVISRLVVYKKVSASEMFFNNWPNRVHMEQLIPKIHVDTMKFYGQVEWLFADAMLPKSKLDKIVKENMCAYIRLPNQTLLLHRSVLGPRFIAGLYSGALFIPN